MTRRTVVFVGVFVVFGILLLLRWTAQSRRGDDMAMLECTQLYANATTPSESVLVDTTHPIQQPRGSRTRITCGELR
jgi:hypothetical protein